MGQQGKWGLHQKKLYKCKLFVSLLFKGLILDSPGNSYSAEKAGAGQWEFSFLNDSLLNRNPRLSKKDKGVGLCGHTPKRVVASRYYLEGGFQLSRCSREQELNSDAERNNVPQCGATGQVFTGLEEQWSKERKSRRYRACQYWRKCCWKNHTADGSVTATAAEDE